MVPVLSFSDLMLNTNQGTIQEAPTELLPSDNRCQTNPCWFDIVCVPWNPSALDVSVIVMLEACLLQFLHDLLRLRVGVENGNKRIRPWGDTHALFPLAIHFSPFPTLLFSP